MEPIKIRQGNDFVISWQVIINKGDLLLQDLDYSIELLDPYGRLMPIECEVQGDTAYIRYLGTDQKSLGLYKLTLWINKGKRGQAVVDRCKVVKLVNCSDDAASGGQTGLFICPELSIESVQLAIGIKGDKGDKGDAADPAELDDLRAQIRENRMATARQQEEIDRNKQVNDEQQVQIDTNTEINEKQEIQIGEDDSATNEEVKSLVSDIFKVK